MKLVLSINTYTLKTQTRLRKINTTTSDNMANPLHPPPSLPASQLARRSVALPPSPPHFSMMAITAVPVYSKASEPSRKMRSHTCRTAFLGRAEANTVRNHCMEKTSASGGS